jgi:hypothetical protein
MAIGVTREANANLARLEAAATLAGCALVCTHQSADELHRALIGEYLSAKGRRQATLFVAALGVVAATLIWL